MKVILFRYRMRGKLITSNISNITASQGYNVNSSIDEVTVLQSLGNGSNRSRVSGCADSDNCSTSVEERSEAHGISWIFWFGLAGEKGFEFFFDSKWLELCIYINISGEISTALSQSRGDCQVLGRKGTGRHSLPLKGLRHTAVVH